MSITEIMKRIRTSKDDLSFFLGREVYLEAFGKCKIGRVASAYRDPENGKLTVEVEWNGGVTDRERFPQILIFLEERRTP